MAKKQKPEEGNGISYDISTKQCYKDQSYLSENVLDARKQHMYLMW